MWTRRPKSLPSTAGRPFTIYVDRIDAVLRNVFGPPVEKLGQALPEPRWRRDVDQGRNVRFTLNAVARAFLLDVAPGRVVSFDFLRSLTQAQLDLFIKVSMLADNSGPRGCTRRTAGKRRRSSSRRFSPGMPRRCWSVFSSRANWFRPHATATACGA